MLSARDYLIQKYTAYQSQGHAVFIVTLSTYVESDAFAAADHMRHFWDYTFVHRVKRCLPTRVIRRLPILEQRKKLLAQRRCHEKRRWSTEEHMDHDFVREWAVNGGWHYHGFIMVTSECVGSIWDGASLRKKLKSGLDDLAHPREQRRLRVNKYEIKLCGDVAGWATYITKQNPQLNK